MKKELLFSLIVAIIMCGIWYIDGVPPLTGECVFCKPDVIQDRVFCNDDLVVCFLTHKPVYPGHSLIIPKRHVERFEDLTIDELTGMMATIKKVHAAHQHVHGECSYFLLQKNGREVGQTVPHVHFHYIPRQPGDYSQLRTFFNMVLAAHVWGPLSREVLREEASVMRDALKTELSFA